jgi:hypothetical protein
LIFFVGNKASPNIYGAINRGNLLLSRDEPQSDDASINESNREEKDKHQDENETEGATIDEPKRAEKDEPKSALIDDSKSKEKEIPIEGRYSNDMSVVNDPVQGEDSEDGEDDTETTETDDSEGEDQHDALMTCIPELVHQICNSDSSDM